MPERLEQAFLLFTSRFDSACSNMAISADSLRELRKFDRRRIVFATTSCSDDRESLLDIGSVLRNQSSLPAALFRVTKDIKRRASEESQLCQKAECGNNPLPELAFLGLSGRRVALREQWRSQVEDQLEVAFELALNTLQEACVGIQASNFILVLDGHQLEVVLGHCARQLVSPNGAVTMANALKRTVATLPAELWQSLTWDRGKELSDHARFSIESGVRVFFADPRSPWQRGTNENTNGLLRQYFPKGTDLSRWSEQEIQAVARTLNNRPRKTLGWKTPAETLNQYLKSVRQPGVATTG